MKDDTKVTRFTLSERLIHWIVALSFLYAALSGLSLWSPRLYWLAAVLGGGVTVRIWHPLVGLLFVGIFAAMFLSWKRQMRLDKDDRRWLRLAHRYAAHDYAALPEAGRFNGGQKSLFWLQSVNGVLLLLSGIVLWWPESMSRPLREAAVLVHPMPGFSRSRASSSISIWARQQRLEHFVE